MACNPSSLSLPSSSSSHDSLPDVVLVKEHLLKKVLGHPPSVDFIEEINLFSHNPDQHPCLQRIAGDDAEPSYFFVFNKEKKLSQIRLARCTADGSGNWFVYGRDKKINDGGQTIAFLKRFLFRSKNENDGKWLDTPWSMKEYRLNPELKELENLKDPKMKNCVLCSISKAKPESNDEGSLKRKHEFDQSNEESSKSVEAKETESRKILKTT